LIEAGPPLIVKRTAGTGRLATRRTDPPVIMVWGCRLVLTRWSSAEDHASFRAQAVACFPGRDDAVAPLRNLFLCSRGWHFTWWSRGAEDRG